MSLTMLCLSVTVLLLLLSVAPLTLAQDPTTRESLALHRCCCAPTSHTAHSTQHTLSLLFCQHDLFGVFFVFFSPFLTRTRPKPSVRRRQDLL
jgi:hypothetical protein